MNILLLSHEVVAHNSNFFFADSIVQVNSLATCQMITQLAKTRGCRFYCEDRSGGQLRLCVAMSRKLIIYQWAGNEFREIKVSSPYLIIYNITYNWYYLRIYAN